MQYILSKSELDDLTNKKSNYLVNKELNKVDLLKRDLQLVCTYAADGNPTIITRYRIMWG